IGYFILLGSTPTFDVEPKFLKIQKQDTACYGIDLPEKRQMTILDHLPIFHMLLHFTGSTPTFDVEPLFPLPD
ncbi:MAG TPA: hypothetical protein PKZ62_10600, partial [Thermoclostridium caenicola]|uniref:hypothetical protein n=1 Tax=Thermoclostridium caenicola TaxID=659425 RepID=UPI002B5EB706